ncbi:aspartate carbamoyltransferase catalytic subunit [Ligilactobacillus saerimneri]|uniref:aspartate carbamoyltransferase catalytic subunit n=1 Tax=Ligilactobacillus saerimneri TaxID=228229 RepID=UPI0024BA9410|nr:aspartate carbamoyltransferase catalytic subunit [Ligilactobacillus saerimneri]
MSIMKQVKLTNFVSVEGLTNDEVMALITRAEAFKQGKTHLELATDVYAANLFFENSTRTKSSFQMAESKLGMKQIVFDPQSSSVKKGETLYDTLLTLNAVGVDLAVIRHPQNEYYQELLNLPANSHLNIGVVNAGDGSGQHPSQCLLDLMTIYEHFGHFQGLKVAIIGDLTNSRVARSNMEMLTQLGAEVYFSGPKYWFTEEFEHYGQYLPVDDLVDQMDVVMLLRVQHERHQDDANEAQFDAAQYHAQYGINQARYDRLQDDAIIMHPGPINRGVELASNLVEAPKSMFFQQMQNGVFARMAMIEAVLRGRKLGGLN